MDSAAEFMDMVLTGSSPEDVSDKIKEILYSKSSGIIDELKPIVAQSMFAPEEE